MLRLFVALDLPDGLKSDLLAICGGVPGAKWRRHDQLHLTLRFIGEVDGALARDVRDALSGIDAPGFDLRVRGIGHFGDRKRPRVLWAGVEDNDELKRLQSKVARRLREVGLDDEHRKFHPHITLARLQGTPISEITAFESMFGGFSAPSFPVEDFILFSSYLSGEGAVYTPEAVYPLNS